MFDLVREYSSRNARRDNCKDLVIIIISINTSMEGFCHIYLNEYTKQMIVET